MSYWQCTVPNCLNKSLFVNGDCRDCGARLCGTHAGHEDFHPCEGMDIETRYQGRAEADTEMASLAIILQKLDTLTITRQAEELRPGHSCNIPLDSLEMANINCHGTNVHFPVVFDDGKKWMVRVRQPGKGRPPYEVMRDTSLSEAATFRALKDGGVLVPEVWVPNLANEADTLIYYFVEFIEGQPYEPFTDTHYLEPASLTLKAIQKVAKWFLALEAVHFDSVGSLRFDLDTSGNLAVGPVIDLLPQNGSSPFFRGPYKTAKERYVDFFDTAMKQILARTRSLANLDVDDYLIAIEIKSLVSDCRELEEGPWFIKHGEDKGDHILFREDGTVSGVIDWDWLNHGSYTTCKADAFVAPLGFCNGPYWSGSNAICPYEAALMDAYVKLDRPDLAKLVRTGKKFRRLNDYMLGDFPHITELCSLQRAFKGEPDPHNNTKTSAEELRAILTEKYKDDKGLQAIIARNNV